jgi:hypothetical protein
MDPTATLGNGFTDTYQPGHLRPSRVAGTTSISRRRRIGWPCRVRGAPIKLLALTVPRARLASDHAKPQHVVRQLQAGNRAPAARIGWHGRASGDHEGALELHAVQASNDRLILSSQRNRRLRRTDTGASRGRATPFVLTSARVGLLVWRRGDHASPAQLAPCRTIVCSRDCLCPEGAAWRRARRDCLRQMEQFGGVCG